MTRGPLPLGYLTLTRHRRTLAYFSFRFGDGDVFLRDLQTGSEKPLAQGSDGAKGYPAISPTGNLLAVGMRMFGAERALRPICVLDLRDGTWRSLGDDCGGRRREWVDERVLIIERFAGLNSIAIIDTETGEQSDLLQSSERSVSNPRLPPDPRWIAFDASRSGAQASVFVAPFQPEPIAESAWIEADRAASHPFWSADGRLLYYTQIGTNPSVRSAVRARHFASPSGLAPGQSIGVYRSSEMLMRAYLPGTTPIATPDQIIFVLGDFRGDVWITDLDP